MLQHRIPPAPARRLRLPALVTLTGMLTSGCLGHYYELSRPELERLVRPPPQERGQGIYGLQQFSTAPEPEPAPPWPAPEGMPPEGYQPEVTSGYWIPNF